LKTILFNEPDKFKKWKDCLGKHFNTVLEKTNKRTDKRNDSLLHWAGFTGNLEIAESLLESKADPHAKGHRNHDYYDNLSLFLCIHIKYLKKETISKILAIDKVNLHIKTEKNNNAFSIIFNMMLDSIQNNKLSDFHQWRELLKDRFNLFINTKSENNETLLNCLARQGDIDLCEKLIEAKADPLIKDFENENYYANLSLSLNNLAKTKNFENIKKILLMKEVITPENFISDHILIAVKNNDVSDLNKWKDCLGDRFHDFVQKKINDDSLLHIAAKLGNIEMVNSLIEAKADALELDSNNFTYTDNLSIAIITLAKENQIEKIKKILALPNINLDIKKNNITPSAVIFHCIFNAIVNLPRLQQWQDCLNDRFQDFINMANNKNDFMLLWAGYLGLMDTTEFLLNAKANPEVRGYQNLNYIDNLSISIYELAQKKDFKTMKTILEKKEVDINIQFMAQNVKKHPPEIIFKSLITAVKNNNLTELQQWQDTLSDRFADFLNKKDELQNSLLHWAGLNGNEDIADNLLELKADPLSTNKSGYNYSKCLSWHMLELIKDNNYTKLKKILTFKEVDWDFISSTGETAHDILKNKLINCINQNKYDEYKQLITIHPTEVQKILIEQKTSPDVETKILNTHLIQLIHHKKFKELADILLDDQSIDLSMADEKGMSPEKALFNLLKSSIETINEETFMLLKTSVREDYFKKIINMVDAEGNTLLTAALLSKNKKFEDVLKEAGADLRYDFVTIFQNLPKQAFAIPPLMKPTREMKIYKASPVSTYKKGGKNTEFKKQFTQLLNSFENWGVINKCCGTSEKHGLHSIQQNFFTEEYSGMQLNHYFENNKNNLEQIYKILNDDFVELSKKTKQYSILCKNLSMCSPGISGHIASVLIDLKSSVSLAKWLAEKRTSIIHIAADKHNKTNKISDNVSIHTYLTLHKEASTEQWNPLMDVKELKDPFASLAGFANDEKGNLHREDFRLFFMKEYNPETIQACIKANLDIELISLCKNFGYDYLEYNSMSDNHSFQQFTSQLKNLLAELGTHIPLGDYILHDDDYINFKIDPNPILEELCKIVLSNQKNPYLQSSRNDKNMLFSNSKLSSKHNVAEKADKEFKLLG